MSIFADNQAVRLLNVRFAQGNAVPHPARVLGRDLAEVGPAEGPEVAQGRGVVLERGTAPAHQGKACSLIEASSLCISLVFSGRQPLIMIATVF